MIRYRFICLLLPCHLLFLPSQAQFSKMQGFGKLSFPEKRWVLFHPFVAGKALRVSLYARETTLKMKQNHGLDGDDAGGQLDAFRHAFWMALLCGEIGVRRARRLGIAHEKGNQRDFKRHREEEGLPADLVSCQMDLYNNESGISIYQQYGDVSRDTLQQLVVRHILRGNMKVVKKDEAGHSLDEQGDIIPPEKWKGKWINSRCLVPSDYRQHPIIHRIDDMRPNAPQR